VPAQSLVPVAGQHAENQRSLMAENGEAMEVILHWDCAGSTAEQYGLSFGEGLRVYVDAQMQRLVLERHYPQYGLCGTRSVPLPRGRSETAGILR
jgi:beta-fructofuranosidase